MQNIIKPMLNIITVTYNEEINLHKYFLGLKNLEPYFIVKKHIVDQSSTDKTVEIIKQQGEVALYIHENKGYADPDKKRIFEHCINHEKERCFIIDPDEEVSLENAKEIHALITQNTCDIIKINIDSIIRDISIGASYQARIFQKGAVVLTEKVHDYITLLSTNIQNSKTLLRNDDKKYHGKSIEILINKINKYSSLEANTVVKKSNNQIILGFIKGLFVGAGYIFIKQKLLFKGWKGIFLGSVILINHIITYAKFYEKHHYPHD